MAYSGRCLCGAVTYKAKGEPHGPHACHCDDCQRFTGSTYVGVLFKGADVEGPVHWFQSSDWGERGSCERCGSAMFWRLRDNHENFVVSIGSLNDKSGLGEITEHYFADNIPSSFDFTGSAQRLSREETLARFAGGAE